MKKLVIFILIIGGFIGVIILINKPTILQTANISLPSSQSAMIKLQYYPTFAKLRIGSHFYNSPNGNLAVSINPGFHHLTLSAPGYSVWSKDVAVTSREIKQFPFIYLFPIHWEQKNIISKNIAQFYLSSDANKILYLTNEAEPQWCIYQRQTKESKCFFTSSSLPKKVIISPSFKKAIAQYKSNKWQLIFLPPSLVTQPLSLNNNITKGQIDNVYFSPKDENTLIIQTSQGISTFNFINNKVDLLYPSSTSPLLVTKNALYFLTSEGILTTIDLSSASSTSKTISSFSFIASDPTGIVIKKLPDSNTFFVIDNSHTLYLLSPNKQIPSTVANNVQDIKFSPSLKYFIIWADKKISIASYPGLIIQDDNIFSSTLPSWFLNDNYLLINNNSNLNILNLSTKKIWPVTNKVSSHIYYFDSATRYIFYLSPTGIYQVSV